MFLSSVDILGFKSFPHRTRIEFASGLTGVVGPNGCGKTNVLDAIRWVLGEQRTSVLRGGKMEDIIFSGTREIKPIGMAEVSLTVINDDNRLPTEYSSVTITRRLYRSGESEYLLNKTPCRLKDIIELFADTGMGANAYSAIELAMVEAILSDKADQRRQLFEEAAGITKYKIRKRAALRKLEATDNDLLRLNDILSEVSSQVNSLKRQMSKAERYKTLTDRVGHIEFVLLKDEFRSLSQELSAVREDKRAAEIKLAQAQAEIDKWELLREDAENKIAELSDELHQLRVRIEAAADKYHRLNNELAIALERIKGAQAADQNDEQELLGITRKRGQLQQELEQSREQREALRGQLVELEAAEQQRSAELATQLDLLQGARRDSQDAQRNLFAIEGQQSVFEQSEQQLQDQLSNTTADCEQLRHKLTAAGDELSAIESQLEELQTREQDITSSREQLDQLLLRTRADAIKAGAALEDRLAQLAEATLDVKSTEAHVHMVTDMIASYEGYGSGVSALLGEKDRFEGLIDTVANLITVEPEYAAAVESALGESAQYVVVGERTVAESAIDYLRENDLGSVTFLLLDQIPAAVDTATVNLGPDTSGILARAREVVTAVAGYDRLADLLFGELLIVTDRRTARQIQAEHNLPTVSLTGEFSSTSYQLEGGSGREARLVGREARLTVLHEKLAWAGAELARLRFEKNRQDSECQDIAARQAQLADKLQQIGRDLSELDLARSKTELQRKNVRERRSELESRISDLDEKSAGYQVKLDQLRSDHQRLTGDSDGRRNDLVSQEQKVEEIEHEAERLGHRQEEVRSQLIRARTELGSLENNIDRSGQLLTDLEREAQRRSQDRLARKDEVSQLEARVVEIRGELEETGNQQDHLRSDEQDLVERQQGLSLTQSEQGELLKAARREKETERNVHEQLLVRETELKSGYEEARRLLRANHDVDPDHLELPEPLESETAAELRLEMEESRNKRAQMGMVNMLALEEYDRESQREEFLRRQIDDLTQAKDNLKTTITRINSTARKLFSDTFEQVRQNFKQIFVELFQGGDADIKLADEEDPLESPILISARPRGKRLLNISQLSGGEKALTAISLLFAIYLVKPSPFCILDEVDAPLDDANVGRFLKIVRTFSERTQFVVITHNKRTMEQCARLYGITMQQAGVSQIVSVDFEKLGHELVPESMSYTEIEPKAPVAEPKAVVEAMTEVAVEQGAKEE